MLIKQWMLIVWTYLDIGNSVYFPIACIEINDFVDAKLLLTLNFKVKYRDYENVKKYICRLGNQLNEKNGNAI